MSQRVNRLNLSSRPRDARKRIARALELLDWQLFLELNHEPSRSAIMLGSGRSGTTWLAESIANQCKSRVVFEPFNPRWAPINSDMRLFLHPDDKDPVLEESVHRVLAGRVRGRRIDLGLSTRLPHSRIIKDVSAANRLTWFRVHYPDVPIIFVLRHPIAASLSRLRARSFYGIGDYLATPSGRQDAESSPVARWLPLYDSYRMDEDRLVGHVAEWCIENVYPLSHVGDGGVALAFYENIVVDPLPELTRLTAFCRGALGPARRGPLSVDQARKPSAMDWFGTAATARESGDWTKTLSRWTDEIPLPVIDQCLKVLREFGLDRFYGEDPMPVGADLIRE